MFEISHRTFFLDKKHKNHKLKTMKSFEVIINHEIYNTYRVNAENQEQAEKLVQEGEFEYLSDVTCVSNEHIKTQEVESEIVELEEIGKEEIYKEIINLGLDALLNSGMDAVRKEKINQVIDYAQNEYLNA